jgi:hypothetical protein
MGFNSGGRRWAELERALSGAPDTVGAADRSAGRSAGWGWWGLPCVVA